MASRSGPDGEPSGPRFRPRDGLHLRPLNVEKGSHRTALSQRRNLLFVAYSHQIYVWEPAGSFQMLGSQPEMIITPVMKEPHSSGYISPSFPHAINNLLVDDLGREEVLLLVTDSGNVCGYRVEAIFSALKRATENKDDKRPLDGSQVDPFFVEYVQASAWGLAIHKFARLIAVSANTGLITVFAFALVNPTSKDGSDELENEPHLTDYDQTWLDIRSIEQFAQLQRLMPGKHRTRNIKLTYTGHFSNIPSVGFYNCDLDPNGTWMVSTDIDNKLLVWKIWESLGPFNVYHFNESTIRSFPETFRNDTERGWAVLALDPRTFQPVKTTEEAFGGQPLRRKRRGQIVLDITRLSNRIPDASHLYNYFPPAVRPEPGQSVLPDIFGADCRISSDAHKQAYSTRPKGHPANHSSSSDSEPAGEANHPSDAADSLDYHAADGSAAEDEGSESDMNPDPSQTASNRDAVRSGDNENTNRFHNADINLRRHRETGPLTTAEFLQFALLEALGGDIPGAEEYFDDNLDYSDIDDDDQGEESDDTDEEMDDAEDRSSDSDAISDTGLPAYSGSDALFRFYFPILHFSQTDIRLLPHPLAPQPSVVCGAPLRQPFTRPIVSIRACDRFNMVKSIPEHGIVVAASQKGRAAVIALTQSEETGLSFRVDWIVPFESQEKFGERPLVPLLGMSVSPIQGFEIPPDVPHIPHDVGDGKELKFQFKDVNHDRSNTFTPSSHIKGDSRKIYAPTFPSGPGLRQSPTEREQQYPSTLPECHARATRAYQPEEHWRGWNPSRRYRLLLMYDDHTVLSYEFWYDWKTKVSGEEDGSDEDEVLIV
ncbi:hypothetical protein Asppvi_008923 [Aspergillus pseudoviridinutans]|uniref:Uncharacterized protein n=1 Tax=Aspergillus pseudoviridinutans TaxID=1517512 RepID=A0A9P3EXX3_9EURO|nr:uncharacterized protein Asppvi_008923 [Aspergillus pseudoviridinutans]GIJ89977.1 hypothetical protein Asppvi_008923 [Aspergillus pseudoviridinutans]